MQRLIIGFLAVLLFLGWHYYLFMVAVPGMPEELRRLDKHLRVEQEKLNSAQILNSNLDRVATLIHRNLAASTKDSLATDASLPFMNEMINLTRQLDIELTGLEAGKRKNEKHFTRTPYTLNVRTTYKKFGELVTILEKSDRLVNIDGMRIRNDMNMLTRARNLEDLEKHDFSIHLHTLTLIKSKTKV